MRIDGSENIDFNSGSDQAKAKNVKVMISIITITRHTSKYHSQITACAHIISIIMASSRLTVPHNLTRTMVHVLYNTWEVNGKSHNHNREVQLP